MGTTGNIFILIAFVLLQLHLTTASTCNEDLGLLGSNTIVINLQENTLAGDILFQLTTHDELVYENSTDQSHFIGLYNGSLVANFDIVLDGPGNKDNCEKAKTAIMTVTVWCRNVVTPNIVVVTFVVNYTDDYAPYFTRYNVSVYENAPVGYIILPLNDITVDEDCANNFYFFIDNGISQYFDVVGGSIKQLRLKQQVDFELQKEHQVNLTVSSWVDNGAERKYNSTILTIFVIDVDDMSPVFDDSQFVLHVEEEQIVPSIWYSSNPHIEARDGDVEINTTLVYALEGISPRLIEIEQTNGSLRVLQVLDRETVSSYTAVVKAAQLDLSYKTATAILLIVVDDINDNRPVYTSPNSVSIMEDAPNGNKVMELTGTDQDEGRNAQFTFVIISDVIGAFGIDIEPGTNRTYLIVRNSAALRGQSQAYVQMNLDELEHPAANSQPCDYKNSCAGNVTVYITDVNDHTPIFDNTSYGFSYSSNNSGSSGGAQNIVGQVKATDQDKGDNAKIVYSLNAISGDCSSFSLNQTTGILTATKPLLAGDVCSWIVTACDSPTDSTLRRCSSVYMSVLVELSGGAAVQQNVTILENVPIGTMVTLLTDKGLQTSNTDFEIRNDVLYTKVNLDREKQDEYVVTAVSGQGASAAAAVDIHVYVLDVNDNPPIFDHNVYIVSLSRDVQINQTVQQVNASDKDIGKNGNFEFSLLTGQEYFDIDPRTGEIRLVSFPMINNTDYQLEVHDFGIPSLTGTALLRVYVPLFNDTAIVLVPVARDELLADIKGVASKLSSILGATVTIYSIESLGTAQDIGSKLYISAVSADGTPVTPTVLNSLVEAHALDIYEKFAKSKEIRVNDDKEKLGVLEIVLICVASVLLLATVLLVILWCRSRRKHKLSRRLLHTLNKDTAIYDNPRKSSSPLDAITNNNNKNSNGSVNAQRLLARLSDGSVGHSSVTNLIANKDETTNSRNDSTIQPTHHHYENVLLSHMTNPLTDNDNYNDNSALISPDSTNKDQITTFSSQISDPVIDPMLDVQHNQQASFPSEAGVDAHTGDVWDDDQTLNPNRRHSVKISDADSGLMNDKEIHSDDADENDEEVAHILSESTPSEPDPSKDYTNIDKENVDLMTAPTDPLFLGDPDKSATASNTTKDTDTLSLSEPEPDYAKRVRFHEAIAKLDQEENSDNVDKEANMSIGQFLMQHGDAGRSSAVAANAGDLDDSIEELTAL